MYARMSNLISNLLSQNSRAQAGETDRQTEQAIAKHCSKYKNEEIKAGHGGIPAFKRLRQDDPFFSLRPVWSTQSSRTVGAMQKNPVSEGEGRGEEVSHGGSPSPY